MPRLQGKGYLYQEIGSQREIKHCYLSNAMLLYGHNFCTTHKQTGEFPLPKLNKTQKAALEAIKAGTETQGYATVNAEVAASLGSLVELSPDGADADGSINARISGTGESAPVENAPAVATEDQSPVQAPAAPYSIVDGIPVPEQKRRNRGVVETYPFSKLELGQSFFVSDKAVVKAATFAARRFVVKSETETVANRKGEQVAKLSYTKRFKAFAVTAGHTYSNGFVEQADGFRVFRTA
jgi:hypothetical protein